MEIEMDRETLRQNSVLNMRFNFKETNDMQAKSSLDDQSWHFAGPLWIPEATDTLDYCSRKAVIMIQKLGSGTCCMYIVHTLIDWRRKQGSTYILNPHPGCRDPSWTKYH